MKSNKLLKLITVVLFCFIIILVLMLIYVKNIDTKSEKTASNTTIAVIPTDNTAAASSLNQSESSTNEIRETLDLKLYFFDADNYEKEKEIRTVTIDKKLFQDDITTAINQVLASTGLKINKAVIKGTSISVDLPKEVALKFNSGSAGGISNTNILAATILNLPNIDKLEITVDGVTGVIADHFNFNGIFNKAENSKHYTFIESDNKSTQLEF